MARWSRADLWGVVSLVLFVLAPGYGIVNSPVRFFEIAIGFDLNDLFFFCWFSHSVAGGRGGEGHREEYEGDREKEGGSGFL